MGKKFLPQQGCTRQETKNTDTIIEMVTSPLLHPSILLGEGCTFSCGKHRAGLPWSAITFSCSGLPLNLDLLGSVAPPNLPYQSTFKTINLIFPSLVSWSPESTSILPLTAPVRASHCSCLLFMCQGRKYYVQMYRIFRDSEQAFGNSQIAISKQSENTQYVLKLNKEAGSSKACNVTQAIF